MTGEHQDDWDNFLEPVLFGIRTSVQESTKYTPFYLMHGREARLPLEVEKSEVVSDVAQLGDVQDTIDRLTALREKMFPDASKNIESAQKKQREQYKQRRGSRQEVPIKEGDLVLRLNMLKRTKKGHKGEDTWLGPYKVLEVTEHGSCCLLCTKTEKEVKQKVNVNQLKIYLGPTPTAVVATTPEKGM